MASTKKRVEGFLEREVVQVVELCRRKPGRRYTAPELAKALGMEESTARYAACHASSQGILSQYKGPDGDVWEFGAFPPHWLPYVPGSPGRKIREPKHLLNNPFRVALWMVEAVDKRPVLRAIQKIADANRTVFALHWTWTPEIKRSFGGAWGYWADRVRCVWREFDRGLQIRGVYLSKHRAAEALRHNAAQTLAEQLVNLSIDDVPIGKVTELS